MIPCWHFWRKQHWIYPDKWHCDKCCEKEWRKHAQVHAPRNG